MTPLIIPLAITANPSQGPVQSDVGLLVIGMLIMAVSLLIAGIAVRVQGFQEITRPPAAVVWTKPAKRVLALASAVMVTGITIFAFGAVLNAIMTNN